MPSFNDLPGAARVLEAVLGPELARFDTCLARLRAVPGIDRPGDALDRLAAWSETAGTLAWVARAGFPPGRAPDSLVHALDAAHRREAALRYITAAVTISRHGTRIWDLASPGVLADAAAILAGATEAHPAARSIRTAAWAQTFSAPCWQARHPLVHATLASATLPRLGPVAADDHALAAVILHGILRSRRMPLSLAFAGLTPTPAVGTPLDPLERATAIGRARTAALERVPQALDALREGADRLAAVMPAFPAQPGTFRREIALGLMARPIDTPSGFAERHALGRPATERILRRLRASGEVRFDRAAGRQVFMVPAAIVLLRQLGSHIAAAG